MALRCFFVLSVPTRSAGAGEFSRQFPAAACLIEMYPAAAVTRAPALLRLRSSCILDVWFSFA